MTGEKRLKPWKVEVRFNDLDVNLKKRRLRDCRVEESVLRVEMEPNRKRLVLLVRDKWFRCGDPGVEITDAADMVNECIRKSNSDTDE